jgi:hypothetical protein
VRKMTLLSALMFVGCGYHLDRVPDREPEADLVRDCEGPEGFTRRDLARARMACDLQARKQTREAADARGPVQGLLPLAFDRKDYNRVYNFCLQAVR